MAYVANPLSVWILRNPFTAAAIPLSFGLGGGLLLELFVWNDIFGPFGSVTVAISVLVFGTLAGELLTRSQGSFVMHDDSEPGEPFKFQQVRRVLSLETVVIALGTIQWGFGHLLSESLR